MVRGEPSSGQSIPFDLPTERFSFGSKESRLPLGSLEGSERFAVFRQAFAAVKFAGYQRYVELLACHFDLFSL